MNEKEKERKGREKRAVGRKRRRGKRRGRKKGAVIKKRKEEEKKEMEWVERGRKIKDGKIMVWEGKEAKGGKEKGSCRGEEEVKGRGEREME